MKLIIQGSAADEQSSLRAAAVIFDLNSPFSAPSEDAISEVQKIVREAEADLLNVVNIRGFDIFRQDGASRATIRMMYAA